MQPTKLAQWCLLQGEIEKLLMQSIKAGVSLEALSAIFPSQLKNIDPEVITSIKEAHIEVPIVPRTSLCLSDINLQCINCQSDQVKFAPFIPTFKASNNWVIGGSRTKSGHPIQVDN